MPTTDTTTQSPSTTNPTSVDAEALARAEAEAAKIAEADLVPIRVDIIDAALGALGSMPAIETQRAAIVARFGPDGGKAIDALPAAARAAMNAQGAYAAVDGKALEPMAKALMEKRARFVTVARSLVERGLVSAEALDELRGGQSYVSVTADAQTLIHWFELRAAMIASHTKVTHAELEEFLAEAIDFGSAVKERDRVRIAAMPAAARRARAFTHFVNVFERVRQLVTYVRWREGDYEQIAPSIYAGRTRRSPAEPPLAPPPATPVAPGLPGADPFVRNP